MSTVTTRFVRETDEVAELSSYYYETLLNPVNPTDPTGTLVVPPSAFASLTMELYALGSPNTPILPPTSILNVGRGQFVNFVDPRDGKTKTKLIVITLAADNPIINDALEKEPHKMLIRGTYGPGGSYGIVHEVEYVVKNLVRMPPTP